MRDPAIPQETIDKICERISNGEAMKNICAEEGMPSRYQIHRLAKKNEDLAHSIACAREIAGEIDAEFLDDINQMVLTGELDPQAAAIISSNKKWTAGKKNAAYGDRRAGDSPANPLNIAGNINATVHVTGI